MKDVFPKFALKQYSTHVAMFVIFVHKYVLDKDLKCTCEDDKPSCNLYMALPFFILFALQLWKDKTFNRIWEYTCNCCCGCKFFMVLVHHILKGACVGLLWVLFVLIEGDWYVCCYNTYKEHPDLGCKEKLNLTEKERVLVAKLKNMSMFIGLGILLAGFVMVTFVLTFGWKKCCQGCSDCCGKKDSDCCGKKCSSCCGTCASWCDGKHLYDQMILEEEGNVLTEMIRKAAKEKLTEKIQKKLDTERWRECFDVAELLIKEKTPPGKPEEIPLQDKNSEKVKLVKDAGTSTSL